MVEFVEEDRKVRQTERKEIADKVMHEVEASESVGSCIKPGRFSDTNVEQVKKTCQAGFFNSFQFVLENHPDFKVVHLTWPFVSCFMP